MPVFTGVNPVTNPMTLGWVVNVMGLSKKGRENGESVKKSPTGCYT